MEKSVEKRMEESRTKLHGLIDTIEYVGTMEYLAKFVELFLEKWGGIRS